MGGVDAPRGAAAGSSSELPCRQRKWRGRDPCGFGGADGRERRVVRCPQSFRGVHRRNTRDTPAAGPAGGALVPGSRGRLVTRTVGGDRSCDGELSPTARRRLRLRSSGSLVEVSAEAWLRYAGRFAGYGRTVAAK